ncbi:MAG: hypothetical protein ABIO67_07345, partial [Mycobacteriales bacterium]
MTRRLIALPAAAVLLTLAACGSSSSTVAVDLPTRAPSASTVSAAPTAVASGVPTKTADQTISVTVAGGKVTGPAERVAVKLGSRLRIIVTADVTDEVHVHVYDLTEIVAPESPASIEFVADKPG